MRIIKYTVKANNKEIFIKTFINGKLLHTIKMSEEMRKVFLNNCCKLNMTFEESIIFIQNRLNTVEKLRREEKRELEIRATHYHR